MPGEDLLGLEEIWAFDKECRRQGASERRGYLPMEREVDFIQWQNNVFELCRKLIKVIFMGVGLTDVKSGSISFWKVI